MTPAEQLAKLYQLLAKRYNAPEWALLREVANGTGSRMRRAADAVAMNLWPSRGLEIHGLEVKVYRSDWLRELKNPTKSAPVQKYCDRWWVVSPDDVVVHVDEVPATWGLLIIRGRRGLVAVKEAPKLDPSPLDRDFVAAIGRRMNDSVDAAKRLAREEMDVIEDFQRGLEEGKRQAVIDKEDELHRFKRSHEALTKAIEEFETASGIKIGIWQGRQLGEAVHKLVSASRGPGPEAALKDAVRALERALEVARHELTVLEEFHGRAAE